MRRRGVCRVGAVSAGVEPMEAQRREVLEVDLGVRHEMAPHVPGVDRDQPDSHDPLQPHRLERQERRPDRDRIGNREVADVVQERGRVDPHVLAGRAPPAEGEDAHPRHEHRQRRQHERRPEDGPDADRVRGLAAAGEQDRDDRDHRLGQGGADGREHRTHRPLGKIELAPDPFDAVGEELGADQDDDQRDHEDQDGQRGLLADRVRTSRAVVLSRGCAGMLGSAGALSNIACRAESPGAGSAARAC